ncbi:GNAT family N-acetyltransferase [Psychrobacter sanguinis]|uniref:GNAT family N-acetyltransferase n=2 Tax=Psychrobacter sanguinis TaxID=861445 RepID=A0A844M1A7_9GAMM|nr:GNAT family N-acetyltransferase [Psychrobacter sanguinis]
MVNIMMPNAPILTSAKVRLEPLTQKHATDLAHACQDGKLWETAYTFVPDPQSIPTYIATANDTEDRIAFAVIDMATNQAIGSTSLYRIRPDVKRLSIGYTWYAKSYWRTHVNTECKLLMLTHAFEALDYQTVGWCTDIINTQSQNAIERLGAKKDGIIRGDRIRQDGTITDSVFYSMIADEWPQAKTQLEEKQKRYE